MVAWSILFNTYISSDKVFDTVPLSELFYIDVEIVDPDGELFEFEIKNNLNSTLDKSFQDTSKLSKPAWNPKT